MRFENFGEGRSIFIVHFKLFPIPDEEPRPVKIVLRAANFVIMAQITFNMADIPSYLTLHSIILLVFGSKEKIKEMNMSDTLIELFAEELDVSTSELDDNSSPETISAWDSLAAMNVVAAIEETFEINLSTVEIMKMNSIGAAREVLTAKGKKF